jgi:hypothetical protein
MILEFATKSWLQLQPKGPEYDEDTVCGFDLASFLLLEHRSTQVGNFLLQSFIEPLLLLHDVIIVWMSPWCKLVERLQGQLHVTGCQQLFEQLLDGGRVNFCGQFSAKTITPRVYVTKDAAKEAIATGIIKRGGMRRWYQVRCGALPSVGNTAVSEGENRSFWRSFLSQY